MSKQYKEEINKKALQKTRELYEILPDYVVAALKSRENVLSEKSLLAYSQDMLLFCKYLKNCCENRNFTIFSNTYRYVGKQNADMSGIGEIVDNAAKQEIKELPLDIFEILKPDDIVDFLSFLSYYIDDNGKERTNNKDSKKRKLAAIREVYKYLCLCDYLKNNPAALVATPVEKAKKEIRVLSYDEKAAIVETMTMTDEMTNKQKEMNELLKERDLAILFLFLSTGIRLSELVSLDVSDINLELSYFHVIGKGNKHQAHYFNKQCQTYLKDYYFNHRDKVNPKAGEQAFFLSRRGTRISVRSVEHMISNYSEKALGKDMKISPHKLRSTYGTDLLRLTGDIAMVSENLAHSDISTTKKYYGKVGHEILKRNKEFPELEIEIKK